MDSLTQHGVRVLVTQFHTQSHAYAHRHIFIVVIYVHIHIKHIHIYFIYTVGIKYSNAVSQLIEFKAWINLSGFTVLCACLILKGKILMPRWLLAALTFVISHLLMLCWLKVKLCLWMLSYSHSSKVTEHDSVVQDKMDAKKPIKPKYQEMCTQKDDENRLFINWQSDLIELSRKM